MVKSDDLIWFTGPPFGTFNWYEGTVTKPELPFNVYRIHGKTGKATVATGEINRPNGLAFSPDKSKLYICENLCFSGLKRNRLFMAAGHSLYSVYVNTQGALGG